MTTRARESYSEDFFDFLRAVRDVTKVSDGWRDVESALKISHLDRDEIIGGCDGLAQEIEIEQLDTAYKIAFGVCLGRFLAIRQARRRKTQA